MWGQFALCSDTKRWCLDEFNILSTKVIMFHWQIHKKHLFSPKICMNAPNSSRDKQKESEHMRDKFRRRQLNPPQQLFDIYIYIMSSSIHHLFQSKCGEGNVHESKSTEKNWNKNRKLSDDYFNFSLITQFLRRSKNCVPMHKMSERERIALEQARRDRRSQEREIKKCREWCSHNSSLVSAKMPAKKAAATRVQRVITVHIVYFVFFCT